MVLIVKADAGDKNMTLSLANANTTSQTARERCESIL